jgi:hypothetical protein
LFRVDERPHLVALGTVYAKVPNVRMVKGSTGASGIFQEPQNGMFTDSEHSARRVNRIAFNQSRYDLRPLRCA